MNQRDDGTEEVRSYVRQKMSGDLPPNFVEDVMQDVSRTPQRGRGWAGWPMVAGLATAAAAIAVVGIGLSIFDGNQFGSGETPTPSALTLDPTTQPTTPPSEAEVTELMNGFLEARVAGDGAQQYLNVPEEDIPLLYATTSGAPYERGEFEPVRGIEWPYGFMAFKVRLFAGDTVVEQLFFTPPDGRLGLEYQPDGFGTDIAPTTEDGQPMAVPYNMLDGEVTLHVAHPWIFHNGGLIALIPDGPGVRPTTDGGERRDWDQLFLIADPALDCLTAASPADAAALAESIRSDPDLGATAPVVMSVGGAEALMMDVKIAAGATICVPASVPGGDPLQNALLRLVLDTGSVGATIYYDNGVATGDATGEWMRLYLFDVPEGSSMRVLALAIIAPEARFESVVEAAAPVIDSVEFHAP